MTDGMFPRSFPWVSRFSFRSWPIWRGSDEWFRHTLVVGIPGLASLVIPFKNCDCDDMEDSTCDFPGCPHRSMSPRGSHGSEFETYCMTHDREFWADVLANP